MPDDLVTRLRVGCLHHRTCDVCLKRDMEAADEIERLREENVSLFKQWNDLDQRNEQRHREWTDEIERLRAERADAREAARELYLEAPMGHAWFLERWPWLEETEEGEP